MIQPIKSAKTVGVAVLPTLLKLNLQFFSDELGGEPLETEVETDTELEGSEQNLDTSVNTQDVADPEEKPFKEDPQNQAFAQMRREKEAMEQQVKAMDAQIFRLYGESHGIHTMAEYQAALEAEAQEAERQKYVDAGLPDEVIEKLSKVDQVLAKAEQEEFNRQLLDNFNDLSKEYPDMVTQPEDVPEEVWKRWDDGKSGLTLTEAFELANKKAIREKLQASSKQAALNKINGKSHLRSNGGEGADDVDLTSVPSDTMQMYRQMFAKELRSGQMTEADIVKHYKNSK